MFESETARFAVSIGLFSSSEDLLLAAQTPSPIEQLNRQMGREPDQLSLDPVDVNENPDAQTIAWCADDGDCRSGPIALVRISDGCNILVVARGVGRPESTDTASEVARLVDVLDGCSTESATVASPPVTEDSEFG